MPSEKDSLIERVQSSYRKLAEIASDLNKVSDTLGEMIAELDLALKKLNVGITVWVQVRGNENEETLDHWSEQIGYAKVAGKWGIALRTVTGNYQYPDQDSVEEWSFNEAPRQMRLSAIGRIPELFEQLSEHAASTTQKIVEKLLETQDLVSAIKKAAAEPTATSQSPIRRRPITGGQKQ